MIYGAQDRHLALLVCQRDCSMRLRNQGWMGGTAEQLALLYFPSKQG
jgi:hypothetical protein